MTTQTEQYPDVAQVRAQARLAWEKKFKQRIGLQDRIGMSVPWWLIFIAATFYALSAPHTASTFDQLAPGWGWAAPVGVEFGLLYAAFRRRQLRGFRVPVTLWVMEVLLFITAVIVNGAGSFTSVVQRVGIQDLPLAELLGRFGALPAPSQVALVMAPIAAFIIPVGAVVVGESMAALVLERRQGTDPIDQRWASEGRLVEFEALRDAAINMGIAAGKANKWAAQVLGTAGPNVPSGQDIPTVSVVRPVSVRTPSDTLTDGGHASVAALSAGGPKPTPSAIGQDKQQIVRDYLTVNPDAIKLSARKLADMTGVGKTTVGDVLQELRQNMDTEPVEVPTQVR